MAKVITTNHPEIGYSHNVAIVEQALRCHFGFEDNSHVLTAVAAHIWSAICGTGEEKRWGSDHVKHALDCIRARLADLDGALGRIAPELSPLRLSAHIRQHAGESVTSGSGVELFSATTDASKTSAIAVLSGARALEHAQQILLAVNGRRLQQTAAFKANKPGATVADPAPPVK